MILETGEADELHYSYTAVVIVRVLKPRTVRVVGCVASMGDLNSTTFWEQDAS